jgi:rhodanese-related sulfurtransferase
VSAFGDPGAELAPSELARLIEADAALQVVDVRETHERDAGHIAGTVHIELDQLTSRAQEIDRERPVVFYCRVGARSAMAMEAFRAGGWDARSLAGGVEAWAAAGLPLAPADP